MIKIRCIAHTALRSTCTIFMTGPHFDLGGNIKTDLGEIKCKVVNCI